MKKLALTIVCVLAALGVAAQSHSYRDTVRVWYEQFDFDAWVMADTVYHGKVFQNYPIYPGGYWNQPLQNSDILQYNYTNNPEGVEVVGLSAAVLFRRAELTHNAPLEYLMLYDAVTDTFELKGRLQWDETDTAGRPNGRYLHNNVIRCGLPSTSLGYLEYPDTHIYGLKVWNLYFDKPITVYDSFYVGGTSRFMSALMSPEASSIYSLSSYIVFMPSWVVNDTVCGPISLWKMYHYPNTGGVPLNQWEWKQTNQFLMILPIIDMVDTSFANAPECPRVSGMFLRGNYTDTVTVQWAMDSLHSEFELSYGREGTTAEDGTIVPVRNANRWQFTDTTYSDTPMVAYVRTVCREYDTLRWSGWSSPMYWRLHYEADTSHGDTTHHEGIVVPDDRSDLSRFVRLMPNPASGGVTVMSSYGIDGLEVYDVRGERVLELSGVGRGTSAGFDVSKWTKGTYVVLVHTPVGTTAKRLVVN